MTTNRVRIGIAVLVIAAVVAGAWWWSTRNRESTDDAQVDAGVTPIAARVGGTVIRVPIVDNQQVAEGDVLVEIDRRDYEVALDRARAELADARPRRCRACRSAHHLDDHDEQRDHRARRYRGPRRK